MDASALLEKMRANELTQEEFYSVVDRVRDGPHEEDLYLLMYMLRIGGHGENLKGIVEKFLYYPKDPNVSKEALKALCSEWGYTADYLEEVKNFIKGVNWDTHDDIRSSAIFIAGIYLRTSFDRELNQLLLNVFENFGSTPTLLEINENYRDSIRALAYCAIIYSLEGKELDIFELEKTEEIINQKRFSELDEDMLKNARER